MLCILSTQPADGMDQLQDVLKELGCSMQLVESLEGEKHGRAPNLTHFVHVASCCLMLPHVASCCLMLPHVASCCLMLPHVASCCLFDN